MGFNAMTKALAAEFECAQALSDTFARMLS